MSPQAQNDLTRTTLVVLFIGVLIVGSLWTMLPFLGALIWATTIVVATWPLMLRVQRLVGGKQNLATVVMTSVALAIFIVPFSLAIGALIEGAAQGADLLRTYLTNGLGPPPDWVNKLPWVGAELPMSGGSLPRAAPTCCSKRCGRMSVRSPLPSCRSPAGLAPRLLHFLLTVIIAAILYSNGEVAAEGVLRFFRRFGDRRGEEIVHLAGQSIRGVALGVVVTAIVQSLIAGLGLWVAGVPRPGLLTAVIFVLGIAQLGPLPVLAAGRDLALLVRQCRLGGGALRVDDPRGRARQRPAADPDQARRGLAADPDHHRRHRRPDRASGWSASSSARSSSP